MTSNRKKLIAATAVVGLLAAGGAAIATATGDDDATDRPISGAALGPASAAALVHTGGGKVTETEVGDEEGYYEVEVTLPDGSQVDVHLDRGFKVLSQVADSENDAG